jgi:hypothetical protein
MACNRSCAFGGECDCERAQPVREFPDRLDAVEMEARERASLFACDELMADEAGRLTLKRSMSDWPGGNGELPNG